jgi:hypothetical protein
MAKVAKLYKGFTSNYSADVEVAESVNGKWFCREKVRTKWGPSWSKWAEVKEPKSPTKIPCRIEMAGAPDFVEVEKGKYIEWGFTELRLAEGGSDYGYRLPN